MSFTGYSTDTRKLHKKFRNAVPVQNEISKEDIIVCLRMFTSGMILTWISPTSAKLVSNDPDINPLGQPITTFQLSVIGSSTLLGSVIGPPLLRQVYDFYGRRKSVLAISIAQVILMAVLAVATRIYIFYVTLLLIGICMGGSIVGLIVYSSEITEDHNRAKFLCYLFIAVPLGNISTFLCGHFFSVKVLTLICMIPLVIHVICFYIFLPESPVYSISKGNRESAMKALTKLRNKSFSSLENEAEEIEKFLAKRSTITDQSIVALITKNKAAQKGLVMMSVMNILIAFSGISAIMAYMEPIFDAANIGISGYLCSIMAGIVKALCCFCASFIVEKWGRRPLLLVSSISSAIPLFFLGLFFYLQKTDSLFLQYFLWVPIPSMILYSVGNCIGFTSIPAAIASEIFTMDVKAFAISLIIFCKNFEAAAVVFCFPMVTETFGYAWTFWIFSGICALASFYIYYEVPETKGRSLVEIQEMLNK